MAERHLNSIFDTKTPGESDDGFAFINEGSGRICRTSFSANTTATTGGVA